MPLNSIIVGALCIHYHKYGNLYIKRSWNCFSSKSRYLIKVDSNSINLSLKHTVLKCCIILFIYGHDNNNNGSALMVSTISSLKIIYPRPLLVTWVSSCLDWPHVANYSSDQCWEWSQCQAMSTGCPARSSKVTLKQSPQQLAYLARV